MSRAARVTLLAEAKRKQPGPAQHLVLRNRSGLLPRRHVMVAGNPARPGPGSDGNVHGQSPIIGEIIASRSGRRDLEVGVRVYVAPGAGADRAAILDPSGTLCAIVPAGDVHPIPERMADLHPGSIDELAVACHAVRIGRICRRERFGVIGGTALARMIRDVARLEGARYRFPAQQLDVAFAVGAQKAELDAGMAGLLPGGRLVVVSATAEPACLDLGPVLFSGLTVTGCAGAGSADVATALALLDFGEVRLG